MMMMTITTPITHFHGSWLLINHEPKNDGRFKCAIYKQYSINKSSIFGLVSFVHPPWILLYFKWNTHSKEFLCKEMNVSYFFLKSCESWDKTVSVLAIPRAILILQHFGKIFAFARFIISLNSSCVWAGARKVFKFSFNQ